MKTSYPPTNPLFYMYMYVECKPDFMQTVLKKNRFDGGRMKLCCVTRSNLSEGAVFYLFTLCNVNPVVHSNNSYQALLSFGTLCSASDRLQKNAGKFEQLVWTVVCVCYLFNHNILFNRDHYLLFKQQCTREMHTGI